jgi:hypothetical protein
VQSVVVQRHGQSRIMSAPTPWRPSHARWCGAIAAIGAIGQIACWYEASGQVTLRDQLPWAAGASVFAALCAVAAGAWLGVGSVALRRARVQALADARDLFGIPQPSTGVIAGAQVYADAELVTSPRMTMVHRPGCLVVRGKSVEPISATDAERAGLHSCGICGS